MPSKSLPSYLGDVSKYRAWHWIQYKSAEHGPDNVGEARWRAIVNHLTRLMKDGKV
jgi:hypothetical protein